MKQAIAIDSERSRAVRLWIAMAVSMILWLVFSKLVVPWIMETHGNKILEASHHILGRGKKSASHYLGIWDRSVVLPGLAVIAGFWILALIANTRTFFRRCVGEATPGTLGAIRCLICAILLMNVLWENFASIASIPTYASRPVGLMRIFYLLPIGFERFVTNEAALRGFQWWTGILLFLGMIGWRTRLVIPLAAASFFIFTGLLRDYSFFWHQHLVPLYVMVVLSFTPSGDGWSLDRLIKIARNKPVPDGENPSAVYGWARYACWVAVALPYFAAGMSKLRNVGPEWWDPIRMRRILYIDTLTPMQFDWKISLSLAHAPDILVVFLALAGVFGEVLYGLVLVSRIARWILPLAMGLMHIGILFLQNILFIDLIMIQLVFANLTGVRKAIGRWIVNRYSAIQVLYDGRYARCQATIRVLHSLDLFGILVPLDFRSLDLSAYNQKERLSLTENTLEGKMMFVSGAEADSGFIGYRKLSLALPVFWPLALFLFLPGFSAAGSWLYKLITKKPSANGQSNRAYHGERRLEISTLPSVKVGLRPILGVCGLITFMLAIWASRFEFFPFTGMQMYTDKGSLSTAPIYYYKVLARGASGEASKALFDRAMGMYATNGRYRQLLWCCFQSADEVQRAQHFFQAIGAAYNRKSKPKEQITQLEVQLWTCPFSEPKNSSLSKRFVVDLDFARASRPYAGIISN